MSEFPPDAGGTPSKRPPVLSARPSRSEPPGLSRMLASVAVDPMYLVFRLVVAVVEGITSAILKRRDKRKAEKLRKAQEKKQPSKDV